MRRIDEDISKGNFAGAYLLYGEEDFLKLQYRNKLLKALVNEGDNMNFTRFEEDNVNVGQIIDLAETMPFLAEHRVILVTGSGLFKKSDDGLADYIPNIPDATTLIFVESEVDGRAKTTKAIKALGRDIEFKKADERMLGQWIGAKLKDCGKKMKTDAWAEFLARTGSSMDNMDMEFNKLVSYVGDREQIVLEDVQTICIAGIETKIFAMMDAMSSKDINKLLELYHDMLSAKAEPMYILSMITRQFRQMKVVKELMGQGANSGTIAQKMGMMDFQVRKLMPLCKNYTAAEINNLLSDAAEYEQKFKSGRLEDTLAVEMIMMKYAGQE